MTDEAELAIYGNRHLPTGTADRPLVSFALFAYNQERFVREAVEGAFAQTYSPLEIILSDDCSSDRTCEIMEAMAREYQGPHLVKVRRGEQNLGLIKHVNCIAVLSRANLIVLAAGDDISMPLRTAKISEIFIRNSNISLVHSNVREILEDGRPGAIAIPPIRDGKDILSMAVSASIYIGATGGCLTETETYEDLIFGFRAALLGGLHHINEELVLYRTNIGISSVYRRKVEPRLTRRIANIKRQISTLRQRHLDAMKLESTKAGMIDDIISKELEYCLARLTYHAAPKSFLTQLITCPRFSHIKAISSETKYLLGVID
jgi:glycosyltransferase involved in cell wall biosynthesis